MSKYQRQVGIPFSRIHDDRELPCLVPLSWKLAIGIVGLCMSGKTTLLGHLQEEHGFRFFSLSRILRNLAAARAVPLVARPKLQDYGDELRSTFGREYLAREAIKAIYRDRVEGGEGIDEVAIGGIKNLGEVEALCKIENFFLVGVTAPVELRRDRAVKDGWFEGSLDDWRSRIDARDLQETNECGQQVGKCIAKAQIEIRNDGSKKDLLSRCDEIVRDLRLKTI